MKFLVELEDTFSDFSENNQFFLFLPLLFLFINFYANMRRTAENLDAIRKVFPSKESTFACSGHIKTTDPVTIQYKKKDASIEEVQTPMTGDDQLHKLMTACDVATFGIGKR